MTSPSTDRRPPLWPALLLIMTALLVFVPLAGAQALQETRAGTEASAQETAPIVPAAVLPLSLPADLKVTRIILKDGSFQPILKYEPQGELLRYLSSERFEWEEVLASQVDWAATETYARQGGQKASPRVRELDAEEEAERKRDEELSPLIAPGLRLPATGGVFLLDHFDQQVQVIELAQNSGEVNRNLKGNLLRSAINPLASQRQNIELKGQHARVQAHVPALSIYLNLGQDQDNVSGATAQSVKDRFRIVRLVSDPKKNTRVLGNVKVAIHGKVTQQQKFVSANVEVFSGTWLKITSTETLEPGEYAVVEMLGGNQMNLFVWDFGVDPEARANPAAWCIVPEKVNRSSAAEAPVLLEDKNPQ